jgi:curved DNA-binding protein
MEYKDYYKILGVEKNATEKEIKAAYRRLARKHHPDVNQGNAKSEARFKEINEAYEVLSDKSKRSRYDQLGANWNAFGSRPGTGGRVHVDMRDFGASGFSDFFETFFGRGASGAPDLEELLRRARGGRAVEPGRDVEYEAEVTLEDVARGTTRTVPVGGAVGRKVEFRIPPGVRDGARLRVSGEGEAGAAGSRGDLYLRVHVLPHARFVRDGDDLQQVVSVPLTTAVLGGEASVPTLNGQAAIKVPAHTPSGRVFRLRGQGLPKNGGGRGDLLAELAVALPENLSKRERELFEELRQLGR